MYRPLTAAVCFACALANLSFQGRTAMKLELVLPRTLYLAGEHIDVDVQLTNTGTTPVTAPGLASSETSQPVYRLTGPAYPQGVTFNLRDHQRGATPLSESSAGVQLRPGAMTETGFTIDSFKPVSEPGNYTLGARLDWQGWSAEAAPVNFRVEKAAFLESSLGVDIFSRSARAMRAVWIAQSPQGKLLGESFLYEKRPDVGEVQVTGTRIIRHVGENASHPFCPWINFDRIEASKFWHGWQEGSALTAFSDDESQPRTFDMGSSKAEIVQPALMNRSGDLEVLVLGQDRKTLRLIRFPAAIEKPFAAWTIELPQQVSALSLAVGPAAEGGHRVAACVYQKGFSVAVHLVRIQETSAQIEPATLFDMAFVLPNSSPAVSILPDGSVRVAVLFAKHPGLRSLAIGDLAGQGSPLNATVTEVGHADAQVLQAWTTYQVTIDGSTQSRWMVRTANGLAGGGDHLVPVTSAVPVAGFVRTSAATYLLVLSPEQGPRLVPTGF